VARLKPCPSFITATRKHIVIETAADQQRQPDFVRLKLSSKKTTSCIVKKQVNPLIWTVLN
jgi:hypothetical protein